jgi:hypothetical protein
MKCEILSVICFVTIHLHLQEMKSKAYGGYKLEKNTQTQEFNMFM